MLQPREVLCILVVSTFILLPVSLAQRCPQGWKGYKNSCYFFSESTANWNTAKAICSTRGAVLASVNSKDEANFFRTTTKSFRNNRSYYVGCNDKTSEGKWTNLDGSAFPTDKTIWGPGQPDDKNTEDCGTFMKFNDYRLNDANCNARYQFICERDINYKDPCDSENGWHLINDRCYRFFQEPANWNEARTSCQDNDADLISVSTSNELSLITESVSCDNKASIWLGYSDSNDVRSVKWVDGSNPPKNVLRWDTRNGEPALNKFAKGKNCAAVITINKNLWEMTNCVSNDFAYICEKDKGQCPVGWRVQNGMCYKSNYVLKSWPAAVKDCEGYGGALATYDQAKNGKVQFSRLYGFWAGISDRGKDGQFADLGGNLVPKTQLAAQKTNNMMECGVWKNSKLLLTTCYSSNYYTCFASLGSVKATPTVPPPDGLMCYDGWVKYKQSCYKSVSTGKNYAAAKADCVTQGGNLVKIGTQDVLDFLVADPLLLNSISWIGLDDLKTTGKYLWNDGSTPTFTNWSPNEPNNLNNKEHCAEVQRTSTYNPASWNDIDCTQTRSYICEIKAVKGSAITTPQPTRPWSSQCGQGWIYDDLSGKCYFFSLEAKGWQDAKKNCEKMTSSLMSVESKYEQSFLQGVLRGDTSGALAYWVGGNDLDMEQGWRWTDKSPFKFFNWNTGEPNSNGDEDCIEVVQLTGKWNDNSCNAKRNYICERHPAVKKIDPFATTPLPTITDDCKKVELLSGTHWVPDSAITASSVRDKDSGPENSRLDWTAADAKVNIKTPDKYEYKPAANLNLKGVTSIRFTVVACNDAHISLQPALSNITRDAYEIVIGGWKNSQSVIRSEHQGATQKRIRKNGLLDCKTAKPFWISWASGKIQVGTGYQVSGSTMLLELPVSDSLTISGIAVTTGWGSTGVWVITNPHGTRKGAWSPKYSVKQVSIGTEQFIYGQYIQVDLAKPTLIRSVTTQGSSSAKEYIVEYSLEYSYDTPYNFQPYLSPGSNNIRYFAANQDQTTSKVNNIEMPFEAQYVRLRPRKFINYPSLRWELNGCPPPKYCDPEKLISGEASLPDWCIKTSSLKAGTVYDSRLSALTGKAKPKGWLAAAPDVTANVLAEEWIQIYLKREMLVHGVITKGHADQAYWVKSFQVQTRSTAGGFKFVNYQEPYGTVKTFTANKDQNSPVTNMFGNPVIATYVRIIPKEYNTMIGMRLDILGCLEGCALSAMLNGPNPISIERLSASSSQSSTMGPSKALLDTTGFGGAWVPKTRTGNFFWQVDFGISERIRAITTQGRSDADQWVKQFSLTYSRDAKTFFNYQGTYRFPGNVDRNTKVKNFFYQEVFARAIRVHPKSWNGAPAMRIELFGCSGSTAKYVGCFTEGSHSESFEGPTSSFSYNGPAKCAASCFKSGYMYAGLNRQTCKCGSTLPIGGQSTRCNYRCRANNKFTCGSYSSGLVSVYETGIGPDDERCPVGYDTYNNKCFKVSKVKQSWQDARAACQADGGDLASINSWAEQSFIRTKLSTLDMGAWIGLNDLQEQMSFEWADGTPVRVTFWQHSEPNNWLGKQEDCVEAISYKEMGKGYTDQQLKSANGWWNDRPCEESRYSICQKKKERMPGPVSTPAPPAGCPFGWKAYQSSCYLMIEHSSTWSLASYTCSKEGGTLVRINDAFEQNFLTTELYRRTGYKYGSGATKYWTDLKQKFSTQDYVWSNNWDVIPYTNWAKGEPKPTKTASSIWWLPRFSINCIAINGQNEQNTGMWVTSGCSSGGFPLCEKPRKGYKQPPLPTLAPEDIDCPSGWVGVGPNCYQVNTKTDTIDMKMWLDAEEHCVKQGAHLGFINNGTENDQLWRNHILQPGSDSNRYWIGLNDRASNKGYQWVSGDGFSYSNWKKGEPNDWDGLEPCVMLAGADGLWNDEKCHIPMNWICSISRSSVKLIRNIRTTPEPTFGPTGSCPNGDDWKYFQKHCYYLNKDLLSFRDANTYCNSKGAHLVSIQSSYENSFVRVVAKSLITNFNDRSSSRANIGSVFTQVWTGLNEIDRSKGHRWIDGSAYRFSNWGQNEPNDYNGGEYCVGMYVQNGEWNDGHCSVKLPSVCEKDPKQVGPVTTTASPHINGYCPKGYMGFENNCFKVVVDSKLNWTTADSTCQNDGGHLASVVNSREQTFLTSQLNVAKKANVALWLGLQHGSIKKNSFFTHATSYAWADNQDVGYTNWNHGEPNGLNKEGCAEMLFNPAGRWNDVGCASERGYICKKPKDGKVTTAPTVDNSRCPTGYTYWENSCYKFVNAKTTWSYFDGNTCSGDGASLVSVQDPYEYAFLKTFMWQQPVTEDVWIGLISQANTNTFTWSNTWPVVVTYWGKNEPANFMAAQGCVLMNSDKGEDDGQWKHTACNEMHPAICKKPLNSPPFKTPPSMLCRSAAGEKWVAHTDGYCYLFNVDPRFTYDEAESACRTAGSNLASIHSDTDTTFITFQMEHMDVKGGQGGTKHVWIGLRKSDSGTFKWSDDSAVYYANWADKEPNSVEGNEKCTEVWTPNSYWNDVDCQSKRGFICKIKQGDQPAKFPAAVNDVPTTAAPTTPRSSPCQLDGWKFYNGTCYLMVSDTSEMLRWNDANDYCSAPGREAKLASIHSEAENQWIVQNLMPGGVVGEAWLGLAELRTDNRFRWIDGTPIPYVNWDTNQPDTNIGSMECVSMRMAGDSGASGRWSTRYCFAKKSFICKIDAKATISAVQGVAVTEGSLCHFPFRYRGQDFTTCTTYGSTYLWCATSDHYERDGQFAICDPYTCPPGWRRHERLCYFFSGPLDSLSWSGAEKSCADKGSDLGYIGSAAVESFITDNIYEYFWIGLNDKNIEGAYQWDHRPNMIMVRGFTNWAIDEPRNRFGTEDCVQIVNGPYSDGRPGEWVMGNCEQPRRYVCMKDAVYTLNPTTAAPTTTTPTTTTPTTTTPTTTTPPPTKPVIVSKPASAAKPSVTMASAPSKAASDKAPTTPKGGGDVAATAGARYQSNPSTADKGLGTGGIVAIVIACIATLLAAVFIFLYVRKNQTAQQSDMAMKSLGFDNASYSRSRDSVQVGLENPGASGLEKPGASGWENPGASN